VSEWGIILSIVIGASAIWLVFESAETRYLLQLPALVQRELRVALSVETEGMPDEVRRSVIRFVHRSRYRIDHFDGRSGILIASSQMPGAHFFRVHVTRQAEGKVHMNIGCQSKLLIVDRDRIARPFLMGVLAQVFADRRT
jgi:hypothetical protein